MKSPSTCGNDSTFNAYRDVRNESGSYKNWANQHIALQAVAASTTHKYNGHDGEYHDGPALFRCLLSLLSSLHCFIYVRIFLFKIKKVVDLLG
jgi:hypothetical protein